MFNANQILGHKSNVFAIVLAAILTLLAVPVIIPHILHGFHIVHIGIHIFGLTLSVFLSILAVIAYNNLKTRKMLFTMIAFSTFVIAEIVTLVDATWPTIYDLDFLTLSEIGHVLLLATLAMLATGVFRND